MKIIKSQNNSAMENTIKGQVSEIPIGYHSSFQRWKLQMEKQPHAKTNFEVTDERLHCNLFQQNWKI
jgi:hypothetical protein